MKGRSLSRRGALPYAAVCLAIAALVAATRPAAAVPVLQLYLDGATYNSATDTWDLESQSLVLWVIADVEAAGSTIFDVALAARVDSSEPIGSIALTPLATGLSPLDHEVADAVSYIGPHGTNDPPERFDGKVLNPGAYNDKIWFEFALGDFGDLTDPIGDYSYDVPTAFPDMGQINAYQVSILGYTSVHFDAYDHTESTAGRPSKSFSYNNPFSHDALAITMEGGNWSQVGVPEPGSCLVVLVGLAGVVRRRRDPRG